MISLLDAQRLNREWIQKCLVLLIFCLAWNPIWSGSQEFTSMIEQGTDESEEVRYHWEGESPDLTENIRLRWDSGEPDTLKKNFDGLPNYLLLVIVIIQVHNP